MLLHTTHPTPPTHLTPPRPMHSTPHHQPMPSHTSLLYPTFKYLYWTIACKDISRAFEIEYSTYRILNRSELCKCSLTAGNYSLSQTDTNYRVMPEARDSYFTTCYAFNKIILDIITVTFDIQVDERTITQSTLLHADIRGYNLPTLEFVLPPVNDNEDLILKEENPEIYVHLENVLVHMR